MLSLVVVPYLRHPITKPGSVFGFVYVFPNSYTLMVFLMLVDYEPTACAHTCGSVATNGAATTNCLAASWCIVWCKRSVNDLVY